MRIKGIHNTEKGYTMIEVILYICILGVLGVVLANYAHRGFIRYRTGRTAQQVIELKRAILQYTAVYDDYTDLDQAEMSVAKAIPLDMRSAGNSIKHALGGTVLIGTASLAPGADETSVDNTYMFYIMFNGIPHNSCVEILTQGQFYGDGGDMDSLIINANLTAANLNDPDLHTYGGDLWYYENSFFDTTLPKNASNEISGNRLTIEQANRACTSKENNNITWIFS